MVSFLAVQPTSAAILKRIQTGSVSLANLVSQTAVIAPVDTSKSFVIATGTETAASPRRQLYTVQLTNGTLVTFTRSQTSANAFDVNYSVVEFLQGVSVQRGFGTLSSTTLDVPISSVGTLANAFVLYSYRNNNNASFGTDDFTRAQLTSLTNLQIVGQLASTSGIFEYQVVTYDSARVQLGTAVFAAATVSTTGTVSSLVPNKTWLYYNCDSAAGTAANIGQKGVLGAITNSTTLTFSRINSAQTMNCAWQAIEFLDRTQVQSGSVAFSTTATTGTISLSPSVRLGNSLIVGGWNNMCGASNFATNDNPGPLCARAQFVSPESATLVRRTTGSIAILPWTVISFSKRRINFQE